MDPCVIMIMTMIKYTHFAPEKYVNRYRKQIQKISKYICFYSRKRKIDPRITLSFMRHESHFKPKVIGPTKDYGLMQLKAKDRYSPDFDHWFKCDLLKIKCNIDRGTRFLYIWKRKCKHHSHKSHWTRHYNWRNRKHHLRVLWLSRAYKKAYENNNKKLYKIIKRDRYRSIKVKMGCLNRLCM